VTADKKPRRAAGIASRKIGEETVLVSPKTGKVFVLNQTGSLIWGMCDGERSVDELATHLAAEFGVLREQAGTDVLELIEELAKRNLVEMV